MGRPCTMEVSDIRVCVVIIWDKRFWERELSSVGAYSVSCSLSGKVQDFKWHLTGVYASNNRVEREGTWWELGAARGLFMGHVWGLQHGQIPNRKKRCH